VIDVDTSKIKRTYPLSKNLLILVGTFLLGTFTTLAWAAWGPHPVMSALVAGASAAAGNPDFANGGGLSRGLHPGGTFEGLFFVYPEKYRSEKGAIVPKEKLLRDVFNRYQAHLQAHLPYQNIPHVRCMYPLSGKPSHGPEEASTHIEWLLHAPDVHLYFIVEWIEKGWHPTLQPNEMDSHYVVRVRYQFFIDKE